VWPVAPFDSPRLTLPFLRDPAVRLSARPLTIVRALAIGAVTGGVASLVVPVAAALIVGGVVAAGLLLPWARVVATVAGLAFIVAGAVNVVRGQQVHHYLPGSNWAGSFVHAGNLIWLGVVLLLADGVITAFGLRPKRPLGRRSKRARPPDGSDGAGAEGEREEGAGAPDSDLEPASEPSDDALTPTGGAAR